MAVHEIETWGDGELLKEGIEILACFYDISLRQLERVYTIIAVFYASSSKDQLRLTPLVSFLSVIKVIKPILFKRLLASDIAYKEVMEITGLIDSSLVEDRASTTINFIMDWVKFTLITNEEFKNLPENDRVKNFYNGSLWKYNIEREEIMPLFTQKIGMFSVV